MQTTMDELRRVMREKTDSELWLILSVETKDYTPEAMRIAREEGRRRGWGEGPVTRPLVSPPAQEHTLDAKTYPRDVLRSELDSQDRDYIKRKARSERGWLVGVLATMMILHGVVQWFEGDSLRDIKQDILWGCIGLWVAWFFSIPYFEMRIGVKETYERVLGIDKRLTAIEADLERTNTLLAKNP
jgi:hypothetical protein